MKELELYDKLINEHQFVDAHEVLEPMWKRYKKIDKDEANILKGFINATTAIALYQKDKKPQYQRVWSAFLKYEILIEHIDSQHKSYYLNLQKLHHDKYKHITEQG